MNVQELIERLEVCDPEAEIYFDAGDIHLMKIKVVKEHVSINSVIISE